MFDFLTAKTTDERMTELERFIEFWYGPRRPEFGEPIAANEYPDLPAVLRRFYTFAGRWPSPGAAEDDYFYSGHGGHHLLSLDLTSTTDDGRLRFFMEYQGDWDGVIPYRHPDPPVWIVGVWDGDDDEEEDDDEREENIETSFRHALRVPRHPLPDGDGVRGRELAVVTLDIQQSRGQTPSLV